MLTRGNRGHGDLEMRVVGGANVDHIDLGVLDDATPIVGRPPVTPFACDPLRPDSIRACDDLK